MPSIPPTKLAKLIPMFFFALFGCIGLAVLIFLWGPGDRFGGPPLIFRVFGSFIALAFIGMGVGVPVLIWKTPVPKIGPEQNPLVPNTTKAPGSYDCPKCGANVQDAGVSPSGDVKCPYCLGWWNIHRNG